MEKFFLLNFVAGCGFIIFTIVVIINLENYEKTTCEIIESRVKLDCNRDKNYCNGYVNVISRSNYTAQIKIYEMKYYPRMINAFQLGTKITCYYKKNPSGLDIDPNIKNKTIAAWISGIASIIFFVVGCCCLYYDVYKKNKINRINRIQNEIVNI